MIRLAVRVRHAQAELVLAELLELAPGGVEEVDVGEGTIEYALYGAAGELPSLPDLTAAAGDALVEISTSQTADDWQERWRRFHRPVLIQPPPSQPSCGARVPALRVRPPWEPPGKDGEWSEEIVINPGQAFGTGAHASTRLCLELLLALAASESPRGAVLDIGTGSGVLAIAAARVGFAPVLALDHERESVQAARANAAANDVGIDVCQFDLRRQMLPWLGEGDAAGGRGSIVVLANLLGPLLLELARTMASAPAHMLAGGLLCDQVDETALAFGGRLGLRVCEQRQSGEWAALWLSTDQAASGTSVAARTIER